jgi:tetratricopeptide (TPR) repeat protein
VDQSGSSGLWMLGVIEAQRGRPAEALPLLEQSVALNPRRWFARKDLGLVLLDLGRPGEALVHLEAARSLSREDATVLTGLADLHLRSGDPAQALEVARRLIVVRPDLALGPYDEGRAHLALGRKDQARASWRRALELDPTLFQAALHLGALELEAGEHERAARSFERATRSPTPDARLLPAAYEGLLRSHLALGDRAAANAALNEARRRMPHEPGLAHLDQLLRP